MAYKIINIRAGDMFEKNCSSRKEFIDKLHFIGEIYFAHVQKNGLLSIDMDGVINQDDSGVIVARYLAGNDGENKYKEYGNMNVEVAKEGIPYCWYAPLCFSGVQLLTGVSPEFNKIVGRNLRLIPDAPRFVDALSQESYNITAVTATHQEVADEIAKNAGIKDVIATQIGISNGQYNGTIERFIGGTYKSRIVRKILNPDDTSYKGTHIGDSWSDTDTLKDVPHSIAFNPGCDLALKNASISIIGSSLLGVLPLLTSSNTYNKELRKDVLPEAVVIMGKDNNVSLEGILKRSKLMKTERIPHRIYEETGKDDRYIEEIIREQLDNSNLNIPTKFNLMSTKEFDKFAREKYNEFSK
ncbi:MAG: haloacid dehalogenase-like hydrolase [Candidatus Woesearchaeota archaeon]|nr:MAG: haloacid dehalogenase-like hydrolase [Candidatus Woesearchaeota archaeon]